MRFGLFFLTEVPRPWDGESDRKVLKEQIEQIELADKLGFEYAWSAEHHFLDEYSHASAPDMIFSAASQITKNIRFGYGIAQLPSNSPYRVAERVNTLDNITGGRVEFGTGEGGPIELEAFGADIPNKRPIWRESLQAIVRMMKEDPFRGYDGEYVHLEPRNILPKPYQRPHPPLWVACPRPETLDLAGRNGLGALSFTLTLEPEKAYEKWVKPYYELIESDDCIPIGETVNANIMAVAPTMVAKTEAEALERGIDGAQFMGYGISASYGLSGWTPDFQRDLYNDFLKNREDAGFSRELATRAMSALAARPAEGDKKTLRGAVGSVEQVREYFERYEQNGMDLLMIQSQLGRNKHEDICESMELIAKEIMPAFLERDEKLRKEKAKRLEPAIERALERKAQQEVAGLPKEPAVS
jgi:alkanesulfonate monooxygenase SsuD/methylene tetrahydromethanopterin reductase-like flavin-dependent oxidoreductase (luciferase family)